MAGEDLLGAEVRKYGLAGDRSVAFAKPNLSAFPWLTGRDRKTETMLLYKANFRDPTDVKNSPIDVLTPQGKTYEVGDPLLAQELSELAGIEVRPIRRYAGLPDSMAISLLGLSTIAAMEERLGMPIDPRRFRENILIATNEQGDGVEDGWVGGLLYIGEEVVVSVVERDPRCAMVGIDPDTGERNPYILKDIAQKRDGCLGVYASVAKPGVIHQGDEVQFKKL